MPSLPSPGPVLQVAFRMGVGASIQTGSRFYLKYSGGPPNVTDLNTLASDIKDYWVTHVASVVAAVESLQGVTVTDLSSDMGAVGSWAGAENGTLSGQESFPASICAIVNHTTGQRYRGGHPRTYLRVGQSNDSSVQASSNEWTTTFQGLVLTAWQAWIAEILAVSSISITIENLVNVAYYKGYNTATPPWRGPGFKYPPKVQDPPLVTPITNSNVAIKMGSQRRRLVT